MGREREQARARGEKMYLRKDPCPIHKSNHKFGVEDGLCNWCYIEGQTRAVAADVEKYGKNKRPWRNVIMLVHADDMAEVSTLVHRLTAARGGTPTHHRIAKARVRLEDASLPPKIKPGPAWRREDWRRAMLDVPMERWADVEAYAQALAMARGRALQHDANLDALRQRGHAGPVSFICHKDDAAALHSYSRAIVR